MAKKMNDDMTYCKGKNCRLRDNCLLYLEGQHVNENFRWMESCNPESRECYYPQN